MADDEQFSLCWNNFNTNLSAGFHESLIRGDLVDVSLVAEGQIVKAHRLVLSVCSPLFRKMFTNMPLNTHAFVYLNNVSHSALKDLIQFMYCGEVNVKQDALPAFISTAESLQIKGLTDNDPAPPPPQEPSPPPAPAPIVQQQPPQPVPAQRVQRQQPRASARYKIETVDDGLGDDNKGTTQIVIQTSAPQAIVQQAQQQQQHIQTQQMQTGTTTTATLVSTNKRAAQRSSLTGGVKRSKTTATTASANIIDPLDSGAETATTSTAQLVPQQITVQTVSAAESKLHPQQLRQQAQQQQQQQEEAEYIDLPMELPTKAEPEYSEDHGDAAGDGDATYVEDDTYGDMRYDDSYFTENEDAGPQAPANTSGNSATATTSKAVVKTQTYSDSSFVDTSADPGNTEAQASRLPTKKSLPRRRLEVVQKGTVVLTFPTIRTMTPKENSPKVLPQVQPQMQKLIDLKNKANILSTSANNHNFVLVGVPRMKGKCVNCLKKGKQGLLRIRTYCDACPGANWMCDACFDELHSNMA
ncbi:modifier of mdg4-like isoform X11 [Drosophila pseudoobscura]|uniref:Modifier of mdg4-like isoform X11 n=1 Tax=Drosophila pseudoobscura pseudoobscura TaxID=46245 RepID=A0A6I8V5B4_DROPS|nr:modifier of mdg4 isoform X11 [Drosophila pseudoobscura]